MMTTKEAESLFLQGKFQECFDALRVLVKDENDGRAQFLLSLFYFYGILVPEDNDQFGEYIDRAADAAEALAFLFMIFPRESSKEKIEAFRDLMKLLRDLAKEKDPFAMHQIGMMYERGLGVKADMEKALSWFERAADLGLVMAMVEAGKLYSNEDLPFYDARKAYVWYLKGAGLGYHEAELHLGDCYYVGFGVEEDVEKAEICFQRAADHGSHEACDALGTIYVLGDGAEPDFDKARKYFEMGAFAGDANCCYKLGDCYFYGRGTEVDLDSAKEWYERAWDLGSAAAAASLGMLHIIHASDSNDEEYEKEQELGFQWVQKAADAGDVNGLAYLGNCYAEGIGVAPDTEKAKTYLTEAANEGQIEAISKLGELALQEGNHFEAIKQFREAADQGYPRAENFLGICYAEGIGVPKNLRSSEEWFRRSDAQGDPDARILMKEYLKI